jgi:hypothetical protein
MLQKLYTFSIMHEYIQHKRQRLATRHWSFGTFVIATVIVIVIVAADGDGRNLCLKTGDGLHIHIFLVISFVPNTELLSVA